MSDNQYAPEKGVRPGRDTGPYGPCACVSGADDARHATTVMTCARDWDPSVLYMRDARALRFYARSGTIREWAAVRQNRAVEPSIESRYARQVWRLLPPRRGRRRVSL